MSTVLDKISKEVKQTYKPTYYKDIILNYQEILDAVEETSQRHVAESLNMTPPKFSAIYNLLVAYAELQNEKV